MTDEQGQAALDDVIKYESVNVWHASSITSVKNITFDHLSAKPSDINSFVINLVVELPEPRNTFQTIFKPNGE